MTSLQACEEAAPAYPATLGEWRVDSAFVDSLSRLVPTDSLHHAMRAVLPAEDLEAAHQHAELHQAGFSGFDMEPTPPWSRSSGWTMRSDERPYYYTLELKPTQAEQREAHAVVPNYLNDSEGSMLVTSAIKSLLYRCGQLQ